MLYMKPNIIYDPRYRAIIARLSEARQRAGFTQAELAAKLGLKQPELSRIESCDRQIELLEFIDWIKYTEPRGLTALAAELEANGV